MLLCFGVCHRMLQALVTRRAPDPMFCSRLLCSDCLIDLLLHTGTSATLAASGAKEAANMGAAAGPASAKLGAAKKTLKVPVKAPSTAPIKAPVDNSVKPTVKAAAKPAAGKPTSDTTAKTIAPLPAASTKGKASGSNAEAAPKAPRAKNAYMFFLADKHQGVKGEAQEHQAIMYNHMLHHRAVQSTAVSALLACVTSVPQMPVVPLYSFVAEYCNKTHCGAPKAAGLSAFTCRRTWPQASIAPCCMFNT